MPAWQHTMTPDQNGLSNHGTEPEPTLHTPSLHGPNTHTHRADLLAELFMILMIFMLCAVGKYVVAVGFVCVF